MKLPGQSRRAPTPTPTPTPTPHADAHADGDSAHATPAAAAAALWRRIGGVSGVRRGGRDGGLDRDRARRIMIEAVGHLVCGDYFDGVATGLGSGDVAARLTLRVNGREFHMDGGVRRAMDLGRVRVWEDQLLD